MHLAAGPGLAPDPTGGANSASPDPLAGFWGGEGENGEKRKTRERKGRSRVP